MSIVHIGYHKTGTTFLQKEVFPRFEGINYIDYEECDETFKDVYGTTTLKFKSYDLERFQIDPNGLYSYERLVGGMGTGTYNYEIAERLKAIGFEKIIITIRRQDKMVEAIYRQYIQQGGVLSPSNFLDDPDYFKWSYLNYLDLIEHYVDVFGRENVLVITQEGLSESLMVNLNKIQNFCDVDEISGRPSLKGKNVSLSFWSIKMLRIVNHFTYNTYRKSNLISNRITTWKFRNFLQSFFDPRVISRIFPNRDFYDEDLKREIRERFNDSNSELDRKYNLNLKKYGYYK